MVDSVFPAAQPHTELGSIVRLFCGAELRKTDIRAVPCFAEGTGRRRRRGDPGRSRLPSSARALASVRVRLRSVGAGGPPRYRRGTVMLAWRCCSSCFRWPCSSRRARRWQRVVPYHPPRPVWALARRPSLATHRTSSATRARLADARLLQGTTARRSRRRCHDTASRSPARSTVTTNRGTVTLSLSGTSDLTTGQFSAAGPIVPQPASSPANRVPTLSGVQGHGTNPAAASPRP